MKNAANTSRRHSSTRKRRARRIPASKPEPICSSIANAEDGHLGPQSRVEDCLEPVLVAYRCGRAAELGAVALADRVEIVAMSSANVIGGVIFAQPVISGAALSEPSAH
jgi:hypothetical protein